MQLNLAAGAVRANVPPRQALGSLRHGPWWPGLDELIEAARSFYPGRLSGTAAALGG